MPNLNNLWARLKGIGQGPVDPTAAAGTEAAEAATNPGFWATLKNSAPMQFMAQHPYQAAGLGILGGANVAGLVDNDKFGGQLGGAALGALGSAALHHFGNVTGLPLAWAPLAGGAVGALFDKSREVREKTPDEYKALQKRFGTYRYDLKNPNDAAEFSQLYGPRDPAELAAFVQAYS